MSGELNTEPMAVDDRILPLNPPVNLQVGSFSLILARRFGELEI